MLRLRAIVCLGLCAGLGASAAVTFSFSGTSGSFSGTNNGGTCNATSGAFCNFGDVFTQNLSGITLTATAWNWAGSGTFAAAELFKSGSSPSFVGLGVCNAAEGIHSDGISGCTNTEGYVDNVGSLDLILFRFSAPVDPTQITLHPTIHSGTDTQYWFGNWSSLSGMNLAALGAVAGTSSSTTINLTGLQSVNAVVFSANQSQTNDGVKVFTLSVEPTAVPEPATMGVVGAALAGLVVLRLRKK